MYQNVINKAVDYVVRNLEANDDTYSLAVASYALQLANHNSKEYILQTLDSRSIRRGETLTIRFLAIEFNNNNLILFFFPHLKDDKKWWEKPIPPSDTKNIWHTKPNSVNIEMTSYALLAILQAGLYVNALPIVKWLVNQRNELGGFQSTQDTFIGLKALSKFAETSSNEYNSVQITYKYGEGTDRSESNLGVNGNNALIQQTYDVSANYICDSRPIFFKRFEKNSFESKKSSVDDVINF